MTKNMDNLISVIIPTYKRQEKLMRAVNTVLVQTHKNIEIIIINDDLENNLSIEMFEHLNDDRIKLVNNKRTKGANGARNTGILIAKGKYLAFLDDDDEWLINYLETQFNRLRITNDKVGLVYGGYLLEKNSKWIPYSYEKEGNLFTELIIGKFSIGASSNIFIKREIINRIGLWDEDLLRQQDLEFLIRIFDGFDAVFNNNMVVKIYGHNEPNPIKAYDEREKFLNKISGQLLKLNEKKVKIFFSNHYRRQALYKIKNGDFKKAKMNWLKAFSYKKVSFNSFRKDIKLVLAVMNKLNSYFE